jgi:hypothetical protein
MEESNKEAKQYSGGSRNKAIYFMSQMTQWGPKHNTELVILARTP